MFKDQSDFFKYFFILFDFITAVLAYGLAFLFRFFVFAEEPGSLNTIEPTNYLFFGALLAVSQIAAFFFVGLYHPRRILNLGEEIFAIVSGVLVNLFTSLSILFFLQVPQISRFMVIYYALLASVLISITHSLIRLVLYKLRARGYNMRTVIILGAGKTGHHMLQLIQNNPVYGFSFLGFVRNHADEVVSKETIDLGNLSDLEAILESKRPNVVIMALDDESLQAVEETMELCDQFGASLKIVPGFASLLTSRGRVETIDGLPIISIRNVPAREGLSRLLKRTFDIIFSVLVIVIGSPLFIAIALAIKVTSRGPVLFKQERVGLDGKPFMMLKYRSMYTQKAAASDTIWTTKDDPRVTSIGRFIRKTSLDEIPQFFNVFFGQMSVVGPRPERPFYVEQFSVQFRHYMRRHAVKAGITGWAQVNGLRGDTSIEDRVKADIYYIEHWSFFFDLKILLMTPFKGFINKNAY